MWSNLDVQNAVLIDAYRRESARLQRQDLQRQQTVLDGLLEGRGADPAFADDARAALDIGADDAVACVVALYDGSAERRARRRSRTGSTGCGIRARWHVRSGVYFGLLSGRAARRGGLVELFAPHAPGRMGVAPSTDGHRRLRDRVPAGARGPRETLARGARRVVSVADRLPEVLLAGSPQVAPAAAGARRSGRCWRSPSRRRTTLLDTLAALLRHDGSPTHAAERAVLPPQHRDLPDEADRAAHRPHLTDPRDKMLLGLALMLRPS